MPTKPPPPPPPATAPPKEKTTAPKAFQTETPKAPPPRLVINAVEGWGKTSCAAFAPSAAIIQAGKETGYITLAAAGRVPTIPHVAVDTWSELLATIQQIKADPQGIKLLALDTLGGMERLCHEHVCKREFGGDWGERGFIAFHRGYSIAINNWLELLVELDCLREQHGIVIFLLSHSQIINYKNPLGPDYDRYATDLHKLTWGVTHKWADAVIFGTFFTIVDTDRPEAKQGKATGGTMRVAYTERRDAWDAKNRYGMPKTLDFTDDPADSWGIIEQAMKGNK